MITLDTITISDNMYLEGLEQQPLVSYSKVKTLNGSSTIMAKSLNNGRTFTLGTTTKNGAIQGIWCQDIIDEIKELEVLAQPVVLNYHGTEYDVLVVDTSDIEQLYQWQPVTSNKKYTGRIVLEQL